MIFKRSVQRYGDTPEPETPFQRAGQLWDERIGSARVQARSWRMAAFAGLGLASALAAALIWQSQQSRVIPYVVAVDDLGEAQAIAPAAQEYRPTDPQIAWHLSRFISNIRAASLDPVMMRANWLSAYDFATARGARFLDDYARTRRPFDHVGDTTVSVQVTSVVRVSDRAFQVKWTETRYDRGAQTDVSRWTGVATILIRAPTSAAILRKNPLGLYVDALDWSRELEPPPSRSHADGAQAGGTPSSTAANDDRPSVPALVDPSRAGAFPTPVEGE